MTTFKLSGLSARTYGRLTDRATMLEQSGGACILHSIDLLPRLLLASLPPASKGRRRYCFQRGVSVLRGAQCLVLSQVFGPRSFPRGYPSPRFFPWSLVPGPFQGCTPVPEPGTRDRGKNLRLGYGYPPAGTRVTPSSPPPPPPPPRPRGTEQQSEYLLRGGRYASCGYTGGLSCCRCVQGCEDVHAYRFYHWQYIDLFIYFSHHFVTIPPSGWSDAAHLHGTPILGKQSILVFSWLNLNFKLC